MVRFSHGTGIVVGMAAILLATWTGAHAHEEPHRSGMPGPVLLTFDVEAEEDVAALEAIDLRHAATYFVTGDFAERHAELVAELARRGTLGSHSFNHPHLPELAVEEQRADLKLAQLLIEKATGQRPVWFRAPFLETDDDTMAILQELGFRHDSSSMERWRDDIPLHSLPISSEGSGMLASDFDLFIKSGWSDQVVLEWLKREFDRRAETSRPMVILLHPRIVGQHLDVLNGFIAHVIAAGGTFVSADQYLAQAALYHPKRRGVWVELNQGPVDLAQLSDDVRTSGITDVFLMVRSPEGDAYSVTDRAALGSDADLFGRAVTALRAHGVAVHAWLPVNHDEATAVAHRDWAMVNTDGEFSDAWLSPSHPQHVAAVLERVRSLATIYDINGIHLDYIRYPDLNHDFSQSAVAAFRGEAGLAIDVPPSSFGDAHYVAWTDWRMQEITNLVHAIRHIMDTSRPGLTLSAALIAEAAISYRGMETFGQDYAALADHLDLLVPMAYHQLDDQPVDWIGKVAEMARHQVGERPLMMGLTAWREPGAWDLPPEELAKSIEFGSQAADGLVFFSYRHLFGRGDAERNLGPEALALVSTTVFAPPIASTTENNGLEPVVSRPFFWLLGGLAIVVATATAGLRLTSNHRVAPTPASDATGLAVLRDYQELDSSATVSAAQFGQISTILRSLGPRNMDRGRIALILDAMVQAPLNLERLLRLMPELPEWRLIALRSLKQAEEHGLATTDGEKARLTAVGRAELEAVRAEGFSTTAWRFVEARLQERLSATCPSCRAANQVYWYWSAFECRTCGTASLITACAPLERSGEVAPGIDGRAA